MYTHTATPQVELASISTYCCYFAMSGWRQAALHRLRLITYALGGGVWLTASFSHFTLKARMISTHHHTCLRLMWNSPPLHHLPGCWVCRQREAAPLPCSTTFIHRLFQTVVGGMAALTVHSSSWWLLLTLSQVNGITSILFVAIFYFRPWRLQ